MRPSDGRISLWPIAVGVLVFVFVALSIESSLVLNSEPPSDFVNTQVLAGKAKPELAAKYWEVAVRLIQWKYSFASALPVRPPDDFALIGTGEERGNSENLAVRFTYWEKLREEW